MQYKPAFENPGDTSNFEEYDEINWRTEYKPISSEEQKLFANF